MEITYDKENDLFHVEIKGIPFGFSRIEMTEIARQASFWLMATDPEFDKWADDLIKRQNKDKIKK